MLAGALSLVVGIVGIVVPLLPTTPFVLLAAACWSRGSERWESWLLAHPRYGPMVRNWRRDRAIPLRAKQLAAVMMAGGSAWAWTRLPVAPWLPALCCSLVLIWMWRLPTARADTSAGTPAVAPDQPVTGPGETPSSSNSDKV
jgi:uncharacterized membrane protein YbaN (DUF454 family)